MADTVAVPARPARIIYAVTVGGTLLWCAAILAAPLLSGGPFSAVADLIYRFFRPVCHQLDHRSFHLFGEPLAACVRCSSIYFAFLAGLLLYPLVLRLDRPVFPPRAVLFLGVLPMIADVTAGVLGIHTVTWATRMATGVVAGMVLPFFTLPAAIDAAGRFVASRTMTPPQKGTSDA